MLNFILFRTWNFMLSIDLIYSYYSFHSQIHDFDVAENYNDMHF